MQEVASVGDLAFRSVDPKTSESNNSGGDANNHHGVYESFNHTTHSASATMTTGILGRLERVALMIVHHAADDGVEVSVGK
jgi:hypothetical protein